MSAHDVETIIGCILLAGAAVTMAAGLVYAARGTGR